MTWVLYYAVTVPLEWFGVKFEVSQFWRDYLGVAAILALSAARTLEGHVGIDAAGG